MQIVTLVIAPAWLSAACYQVTGSLVSFDLPVNGQLLTPVSRFTVLEGKGRR
jgi:hypothetical protein